jgi:hypothetical protein
MGSYEKAQNFNRTLVVPEPLASSAASGFATGSLRGGAPARKEPEFPVLKYKVLVHVTKVQKLVCDAVATRVGVVPGHGQGGGGGGSRGRCWVSRPQPWHKGTPDQRGSSARGAHGKWTKARKQDYHGLVASAVAQAESDSNSN